MDKNAFVILMAVAAALFAEAVVLRLIRIARHVPAKDVLTSTPYERAAGYFYVALMLSFDVFNANSTVWRIVPILIGSISFILGVRELYIRRPKDSVKA